MTLVVALPQLFNRCEWVRRCCTPSAFNPKKIPSTALELRHIWAFRWAASVNCAPAWSAI